MLILIGVFRDSVVSSNSLWSSKFGRTIYNSIMSRSRFQELITCITFYDIDSQPLDKYNKIKELIEHLNSKFTEVYSPSDCLTVDETLSLFRGRTCFLTYMPSKPGRYGILLRTLACAKSR